jgi:streptogramin lyase
MHSRRLAALALVGALSACSGGSGGGALPVSTGIGGPSTPQSLPVTFTMNWSTGVVTAASTRKPQYVPATARSISVSVNGGTLQYLNAPLTTMVIDAPVGTDTFSFVTYDAQNGSGAVLSRASVTKAIVSGVANTVTAVLNGVIAMLTIAFSNATPNAGVPATVNVNVAALDADGNVIVGPGDYDSPIHLTIADPANSGTLTLSVNVLPNSTTAATLTYNGGTLATAQVDATVTGVVSTSATFAPTPTFYQYSIPVPANQPQWIAAGSDGNMWFTESPGNAVARITPAGVVTEFAVPTAASNPQGIIGASDGRLWFTESAASKIGAVTTSGTFTEYSTLFANDGPQGLVDRGDGNVWYVGFSGDHIGYQGISNGVAGETTIPTPASEPYDVATSPDNNLYFTEYAVDKIGRTANLFGTITELALPAGSQPLQIVLYPQYGQLVITEYGTSKIGVLDPGSFSLIRDLPTLTPNSNPTGIVVGQDNAVWFTETGLDKIGRLEMDNTTQTEYTSPVTGLGLKGIAVGPTGALWFTEPGTGLNPGRIGKLVY